MNDAASTDGSKTGGSKFPVSESMGRMLAGIGALFLIVAFFLPWWSMDLSVDIQRAEDAMSSPKRMAEMGDAIISNIDWYMENLTLQMLLEPIYEDVIRGALIDGGGEPRHGDVSFGLGGGKTTVGWLGLLLGIMALMPCVVSKLVPGQDGWVKVAEACLGFLVVPFLVALGIFVITTPGENLDFGAVELSQGISVGPFIALAGALCMLVAFACSIISGARGVESHMGVQPGAAESAPSAEA